MNSVRKLKVAGILALLFFILLAAVAGLLHTPQAQHYALEKASGYLRQKAGIELKVGSFRYSLLKLSVTLKDVTLRSADRDHLPPFLQVEAANVRLSWLALLRGKISVPDTHLVGTTVHLVWDEQGRDNLPGMRTVPPTSGPTPTQGLPPFFISFLEADRGRLVIDDRQHRMSVNLPMWDLQLTGDATGMSHRFHLETHTAGEVILAQRLLAIDHLSLNGVLQRNALEVTRLNMSSGPSSVELDGILKAFSHPDFNFAVAADLDAGAAAHFAGIRESAGGSVHAQASLSGVWEDLKIAAQIQGRDLSFHGYNRVQLTSTARLDRTSGRLAIRNFKLSSPFGSAQGRADLALLQEAGRSSIKAKIEDLNLLAVSRRQLFPIQLASVGNADVTADWPGTDFRRLRGTASVHLLPTLPNAMEKILPVSASLELTANQGSFLASVANVAALGSRWHGIVSLQSTDELGGELIGNVPELERLLSGTTVLLGAKERPLHAGGIHGAMNVTAAVSGTLTEPVFGVAFDSSNIDLGRLQGVALQGKARYVSDSVRLDSVNLLWRGQSLSASGMAQFRGKSPSLEFSAALERGSLHAIVAGLGRELPVEGTINLKAGATGTLVDPKATLSLTAEGLKAYGESMGSLHVAAGLAHRKVEVSRLELDKPLTTGGSGYLKGGGWYDLDSHEYNFETQGKNLAFADLLLPGGTPLAGQINLSARGGGSLDNPSLTGELRVANLELKKRSIGDLRAGLRLEGHRAEFELDVPEFNLSGKATVQTRPPFPARLEFEAARTDLSRMMISLPDGNELEGFVTGTLFGRADLGDWRKGTAELQVGQLEVDLSGQELHNEGAIRVSYDDGMLKVPAAVLLAGDSRLSVHGNLPIEGTYTTGSLEVAGNFDLARMMQLIPARHGFSGRGILKLDGTLGGSLQNIEPSFRASLRDGYLDHPSFYVPLAKIDLDLQYEKGLLSLGELSANFGVARLSASAELPVGALVNRYHLKLEQGQGPARFTVDLKDLQLGDFKNVPEGVSGSLSVHAEGATPDVSDLARLQASITFPEVQLESGGYEVRQAAPIRLSVREGIARIDRLALTGPVTTLEANGRVSLVGNRALDVHLTGNTNAGVLTLFSKSLKAQGDTKFQVALAGSLSSPELSGTVEMKDGQIGLSTPNLLADNLDAQLAFRNGRILIESFSGTLNGGTLDAAGSVGYARGRLEDFHLDVSTNGAFLDYPEGLKTQLQAKLQIRSDDEFVVIGGQANIDQGFYREPIELQGELLKFLESGGGGVTLAEERSPFLLRIRYNVAVRTREPLLVDNNLAKLALDATLRLVGTYYQPGLTGRITLEEGGQIYFNERKYYIEQGSITFENQSKIEPIVSIQATTQVSSYTINLNLSGGAEKFTATFTSEPSLPEPDIISVLLTGRTLNETRGAELNVAKEQALSYLTGSIGGQLSRSLQETLGLSQVRIDPNLISPESNPGARLTIGEDITRFLHLIYSINLTDSRDQIYIVEYDVTKRFTLTATRQSDSSYRFDVRHGLQFGGGPGTGSSRGSVPAPGRIGGISFQGNTVFNNKMLLDNFGVDSGDKYDFFKVQKALDRLRRFYASKGYLEAKVRQGREIKDHTVNLSLRIDPGPEVEFVFEGRNLPGKVQNQVREIWGEGIFDQQRVQEAEQAISEHLIGDGYLQAKVSHEIQTLSESRKLVKFKTDPGKRFHDVNLEFAGASEIPPGRLLALLNSEKLLPSVYLDPAEVSSVLTRYYHQNGYLEAKVKRPDYELDQEAGTGKVLIPIQEGPRFKIGRIEYRGNKVFNDAELNKLLPLKTGEPYTPELLQNAHSRLQALYWGKGYNDVSVSDSAQAVAKSARVDLVYDITENAQGIVKKIEVEGNHETSAAFVKDQMGIAAGDVLDVRKTNEARKSLYDTGAYSLVDIEAHSPAPAAASGGQKPVDVLVQVRETRPFELNYGAFYDTDRGIGGIADFVNHNSLGLARTLGARLRYDSNLHELRGYFSQPLLRTLPLRTNITAYADREFDSTFVTDTLGFSAQEEAHFANKVILSAGYRFERTHVYDTEPDSLFQVLPLNVAPLTLSVTRETRNNLLDATRGDFLSNALEYAPAILGSDLRYIKYYGQYFRYVPLSKRVEIPFSHGERRPRFVYAGALRIGLAKGLGGQDLIPSERFFAGGGTTIRGFKQDEVGPKDFLGNPTGGDATFIMNNELRFPIFSMFDGAAFLDLGNVYETVSDFNPFRVRKSAGAGLRIHTPYFLLRLDYGFKLDRRPGESQGRFFFSIGQAF